MRVWLTSDTHWNHDKPTSPLLAPLPDGCGRPPDFGAIINREWRQLVAPEDLVIHLGDVIFGQASTVGGILKALPGHKILVLGNHDYHHTEDWWYEQGFDFVCQQMVYKGVLLTHHPATDLPHCAVMNVHGHLHNTGDKLMLGFVAKPWHKLLALEHTRYRPVDFDEFCGIKQRGKVVLV